jgi:hypothetical protein
MNPLLASQPCRPLVEAAFVDLNLQKAVAAVAAAVMGASLYHT